MTATLPALEGPADAELILAVRGGDVSAYGDLFARHVQAATRLARQIAPSPADADDLVAEAFAKVLATLQRGGGPDVAFRAYLLTAIRRLRVDRWRAGSRVQPTDDLEAFDPGVPFRDTAVEGFENTAAARAFASLPERWQVVLWHTEVEGQKPAEVALLLGISANSVAALAYRAREGLRQAFLTEHSASFAREECRWTNDQLGAYVRRHSSRRDSAKVELHLKGCRPCMAAYLELCEVNSNLAGVLAPLVLGGLAASYVAAPAGSAAVGGLLISLVGRVRDLVVANAPVSAAVGVAAVGVTTAGVVLAVPDVGGPVRGAAPPAAYATTAAPSSGAIAGPGEPARVGGRSRSTDLIPAIGSVPADSAGEPLPGAPEDSPTPPGPGATPSGSPTPTVTPPGAVPTSGPTPGASPTPGSRTTPAAPRTDPPSDPPEPRSSQPPKPAPSATSTPTSEATPTPSAPPPPPDPDMFVGVTHSRVPPLRWNLQVTIGGIPSEGTVTVSIRGSRAEMAFSTSDGRCSPVAGGVDCLISAPGDTWQVGLDVAARPSDTITFTVSAPGVRDRDLGNNTATLRLTERG